LGILSTAPEAADDVAEAEADDDEYHLIIFIERGE